jgi:hypothetical protein
LNWSKRFEYPSLHYSTTPIVAEATASGGDLMERDGKDALIEDIDKELRAIDARLKKVISKTDVLLKESSETADETESTGDAESTGDVESTGDAENSSNDNQD